MIMKSEGLMNTQYLKEFVILSEEQSFSGAAEKLNTSQSSLTRHIQLLEKRLGKALLNRTTRRMTLTDFGEFVLPYAKRAINAEKDLESALLRWDSEENDILKLGCSHYSHLYTMTENVIAFRKKYPGIQIRTYENALDELALQLKEGRLNLIRMAYPADYPKPERMVINGRGRLVAVVPKTHELAGRTQLSLNDLDKLPLLIPAEKNAFNAVFRKACRNAGVFPEIVSESRIEANLRLLKEGMGILVEDRTIVLQHPDPDLAMIDIRPFIDFYYGLVYAENLSRNESLFVRFVQSRYQPV